MMQLCCRASGVSTVMFRTGPARYLIERIGRTRLYVSEQETTVVHVGVQVYHTTKKTYKNGSIRQIKGHNIGRIGGSATQYG